MGGGEHTHHDNPPRDTDARSPPGQHAPAYSKPRLLVARPNAPSATPPPKHREDTAMAARGPTFICHLPNRAAVRPWHTNTMDMGSATWLNVQSLHVLARGSGHRTVEVAACVCVWGGAGGPCTRIRDRTHARQRLSPRNAAGGQQGQAALSRTMPRWPRSHGPEPPGWRSQTCTGTPRTKPRPPARPARPAASAVIAG